MTNTSLNGVQVDGLTWTPFASSRPLLKDVSFDIRPGERVLLIGPSGSGKSTLLRAIAGVLTESESGVLAGSITTDEAGLLLQDPIDSLVSDSIFREVAFGLENLSTEPEVMPATVVRQLDKVFLIKPLDHPSSQLSGGELQRMAFAGVMAMSPQVLLLDEPTSMLDQLSAQSVRDSVVYQLDSTQGTLLVVEHHFVEWLPLVSRVLVLNDQGELIFDGTPHDLVNGDLPASLGLWFPLLDAPAPKRLDLGTGDGGSLTVLTGKSGAGKTTELKRRLWADQLVNSLEVGYVPQHAELTIIGHTVYESANLTAKRTSDQDRRRTDAVLQGIDVAKLANRSPYEISSGEQRRVAVATALAHSPKRIYLDEPTVGQDRESWAAIVGAILSARAAGIEVIVATHDLDLIKFADENVEISAEVSDATIQTMQPISGLAALAASLVLLVGSMAITSTTRGLLAMLLLVSAGSILGLAGFRFLRPKALLPGLIAIVSIGLSNWYLSAQQLPETGLVAAMRVSIFVIPGIILASQLRPIAFGDQLGQWLRFPARPVVAAAAAMQRVDSTLGLWSELRFIHRMRGLQVGRTPVARVAEFGRLLFAMLVQSIRDAGSLAVAMDARGFSTPPTSGRRTWAAKPKFGKLDLLVISLSIAVAILPALIA